MSMYCIHRTLGVHVHVWYTRHSELKLNKKLILAYVKKLGKVQPARLRSSPICWHDPTAGLRFQSSPLRLPRNQHAAFSCPFLEKSPNYVSRSSHCCVSTHWLYSRAPMINGSKRATRRHRLSATITLSQVTACETQIETKDAHGNNLNFDTQFAFSLTHSNRFKT